MTQKTIKALYKQPVNYKLMKDGYKTINGVIQAQDGMPKVVDLSVPSELYTTDLEYNVDVNVNGAPVITTSEFTLPDDQTCEAKKYCYAPKGTNYNYSSKGIVRYYDNFTKIGSPTISQNGILSDITTSNYLRLPNNFNSGNNSWEMLFKIKTSSDITTEQSWIGSSNKTNFTYPLWRLRNEYICLYLSSDGSNWNISSKAQTFQVSANTWYWVKLKFTGSSYESYYSTNGIDYILAYSVSSTSIIYQNQLWNIGCNNWSEGEYHQWLGIIDLSESYIKINDEIWWVPYTYHEEEVTIQIPGILDSSVITDNWQQNQEYKLYQLKNQNNTDSLQLTENSITDTSQKYKQYINQLTIPARDYKWYYHSIETGVYDNYNVFGNPIIDTTAGIVSGFSTSNYLQLPKAFNPGNNPWEMIFRVKTSSDFSDSKNNITGSNTQSNYQAISCGVSKDHLFKLGISVDGSSWNPGYEYGTYYVLQETWYYIKIQFTGSHYQLHYSLDGNNYILDIDMISSLPVYQNNTPYLIGLNKWSTDSDSWYPWTGTIDLSESYIKINGNLWWLPMSTKDKYKWMANKSIYDYSATGLYADTLDFTKSYVDVNDSEYHKYINPKVCLMPIDGGETKTVYSLNATEIGNTNFDIYTGISNRFSSVDYLQLPQAFNPGNNPWEMIIKIRTASDLQAWQEIFHSSVAPNNSGRYGISVIVDSGNFELDISTDGSSWIGSDHGTFVLSENTNYWVKVGWNSNEYYLEYSTNGADYIRDITYTVSNNLPNLTNSWIGIYRNSDYMYPMLGSIDLSESYIKINDEVWWNGANSEVKEHQYIIAKETVNGCLYNYNDDGSEHSFDVYYDSNYTQPILVPAGQTYSEGTKVDTITIPSHKTWEYSSGGIWNSYTEIDVSNSNYTNTDGNLVLTEYIGNAQDITLPNPEL